MLDLHLKIVDGKIELKINLKTTNKFQYISPRYSHPTHTWKAVALGEMIRANRGSTTEAASLGTRSFLSCKLVERGYPQSLVAAALHITHKTRPTRPKRNITPPLRRDQKNRDSRALPHQNRAKSNFFNSSCMYSTDRVSRSVTWSHTNPSLYDSLMYRSGPSLAEI